MCEEANIMENFFLKILAWRSKLDPQDNRTDSCIWTIFIMADILNILLCSSKLAFFVSIQSSELYIDWNANSISAALWLAEAKILVACGSIAISKKIWLATNVGFFQKLYGWPKSPNRNFSIVLELSCLPFYHWKDRMLCVGWAIVSRVSSDKCGVKNKISVKQNWKYGRNSNRKCRFLLFSVTVFNFWILLWQYLSR